MLLFDIRMALSLYANNMRIDLRETHCVAEKSWSPGTCHIFSGCLESEVGYIVYLGQMFPKLLYCRLRGASYS